jgi:hypothetical protein
VNPWWPLLGEAVRAPLPYPWHPTREPPVDEALLRRVIAGLERLTPQPGPHLTPPKSTRLPRASHGPQAPAPGAPCPGAGVPHHHRRKAHVTSARTLDAAEPAVTTTPDTSVGVAQMITLLCVEDAS